MIIVLLHIRDNNTNSKEKRATTLPIKRNGREREREGEIHIEDRIGTKKDVARKISSNRSKHDIHMHTRREIQLSSLITRASE
jgi:hypothetical protein